MNTLSHTRLAPPLSEILQAGTLCTFRTLKTVFFANVGRLSTSLDPMYIRTTEFFAPLFGSIIVNNFMISLRRAMYSQQHIFCVALIKLCSKRGQGFVLGHSFSLCLFLRRKLCRKPLLGTLYRKPQKMCKSILLWQQQCDTYHSNRSTSVRPFCTKQGWFLMCKFANITKNGTQVPNISKYQIGNGCKCLFCYMVLQPAIGFKELSHKLSQKRRSTV